MEVNVFYRMTVHSMEKALVHLHTSKGVAFIGRGITWYTQTGLSNPLLFWCDKKWGELGCVRVLSIKTCMGVWGDCWLQWWH